MVVSKERQTDARSLARTCQAKSSDERRRRLELDRARATRLSELRAALSFAGAALKCCSGASGSSAKASSSPPPTTTTTPPYTTTTHPPPTSPPPLTYLHLITTSTTVLDYPYIVSACARPQYTRLQYRPNTRRRTRSLHIIHHGSVIENACCCPRNGWRRRCSSAGKRYFMILCRNTMVLALSLYADLQPTIRIPIERAMDQYTWSTARGLLPRDELVDELRLPRACFAPAGQPARCHHNRGKAPVVLVICISIHGASKTTYAAHHNLKHGEETEEIRPIPG